MKAFGHRDLDRSSTLQAVGGQGVKLDRRKASQPTAKDKYKGKNTLDSIEQQTGRGKLSRYKTITREQQQQQKKNGRQARNHHGKRSTSSREQVWTGEVRTAKAAGQEERLFLSHEQRTESGNVLEHLPRY